MQLKLGRILNLTVTQLDDYVQGLEIPKYSRSCQTFEEEESHLYSDSFPQLQILLATVQPPGLRTGTLGINSGATESPASPALLKPFSEIEKLGRLPNEPP